MDEEMDCRLWSPKHADRCFVYLDKSIEINRLWFDPVVGNLELLLLARGSA